MKAAPVSICFGGPEVLKLEELPTPEPGAGEMLVAIRAASINPVDYKMRLGTYPRINASHLPAMAGRDGSGVVERVGPGMTKFKAGDAVYFMVGAGRGTFADHVIVKESEAAAKPQRLDFDAAAAVSLAALSRLAGSVRPRRGEGRPARADPRRLRRRRPSRLQFAKVRGAHVTTTASGDGVAFARGLGADKVIDYKTQRFENVAKDMDMVFDTMSGEVQARSWGVLKPGGILISILGKPDDAKANAHGVRAGLCICEIKGDQLAEIGGLIDAGKVKPGVQKVFPLAQIAEAQAYAERGPIRGKVVVSGSRERDGPISVRPRESGDPGPQSQFECRPGFPLSRERTERELRR